MVESHKTWASIAHTERRFSMTVPTMQSIAATWLICFLWAWNSRAIHGFTMIQNGGSSGSIVGSPKLDPTQLVHRATPLGLKRDSLDKMKDRTFWPWRDCRAGAVSPWKCCGKRETNLKLPATSWRHWKASQGHAMTTRRDCMRNKSRSSCRLKHTGR
jgi:hypothetical protein